MALRFRLGRLCNSINGVPLRSTYLHAKVTPLPAPYVTHASPTPPPRRPTPPRFLCCPWAPPPCPRLAATDLPEAARSLRRNRPWPTTRSSSRSTTFRTSITSWCSKKSLPPTSQLEALRKAGHQLQRLAEAGGKRPRFSCRISATTPMPPWHAGRGLVSGGLSSLKATKRMRSRARRLRPHHHHPGRSMRRHRGPGNRVAARARRRRLSPATWSTRPSTSSMPSSLPTAWPRAATPPATPPTSSTWPASRACAWAACSP